MDSNFEPVHSVINNTNFTSILHRLNQDVYLQNKAESKITEIERKILSELSKPDFDLTKFQLFLEQERVTRAVFSDIICKICLPKEKSEEISRPVSYSTKETNPRGNSLDKILSEPIKKVRFQSEEKPLSMSQTTTTNEELNWTIQVPSKRTYVHTTNNPIQYKSKSRTQKPHLSLNIHQE